MDLDRQAIERRDFPIARRGYDASSVDAHLRALAVEVEELQRRALTGGAGMSMASSAGTHVQSIIEAAEASAAEMERQASERARQVREAADRDAELTRQEAIEKARAHVGAVAQVAASLLERRGRDGQRGASARGKPARGREPPRGRPRGGRIEHGRALRRRIRPRAPSPRRRRSHRPPPAPPRPGRPRRAPSTTSSRAPWTPPSRAPSRSSSPNPARSRAAPVRAAGPEPAPVAGAAPAAAGGRGRGRRRRGAPGRAEHGAQRRDARRHRALPGGELPALRPGEAARRGLRGDRRLELSRPWGRAGMTYGSSGRASVARHRVAEAGARRSSAVAATTCWRSCEAEATSLAGRGPW